MLLLVLGTSRGNTYSQTTKPYLTQLRIGERVPDLPLTNLYNYNGKEKSLGDFKGKLLILDFWATWCVPCIAAFPKMEALREKYKDKIRVLPVTSDSKEKVQALFENIEKDKGFKLFSLVADQQIRTLFNFRFLPHYVILDKEGRYLTDATVEEINESNIEDLLKTGKGRFSTQKTIVTRYDQSKPLFNQYISITEDGLPVTKRVDLDKIVVTSTLSESINDLTGPRMIIKGRVLMTTSTIDKVFGTLFGIAIGGGHTLDNNFYLIPDNRHIWEVKNKRLLDYSSNTINDMFSRNKLEARQFLKEHEFAYEMIANDSVGRQDMAKLAINDINLRLKMFYGFSASVEKRKAKCLVLKRTSSFDKITAGVNAIDEKNNVIKTNVYDTAIKNQNFRFFMLSLVVLSLQNIPTPIIDETGFPPDKIIDIKLKGKMTDWKNVNTALAEYDMTFVEEEREIDMVIISDTKPLQLFPLN